eukprot:GHVP01052402.1.p1 GENE.GHVP01052402.1~~GHVP01052402.1.p1  ORF type:complete len:148 (-),score=31.13 GHVP01052402.1:31-474(-)
MTEDLKGRIRHSRIKEKLCLDKHQNDLEAILQHLLLPVEDNSSSPAPEESDLDPTIKNIMGCINHLKLKSRIKQREEEMPLSPLEEKSCRPLHAESLALDLRDFSRASARQHSAREFVRRNSYIPVIKEPKDPKLDRGFCISFDSAW